MITTTPSPVLKRMRANRAFTLVEVMIGATLSVFVLAAVLSSSLFIGRSAANIANYSDMENEARRSLERFAEDTRQASDLLWNAAGNVSLTVNTATITYSFDESSGEFRRAAGGATTVLLRGIGQFSFKGYMITGAEVSIADLSTAAKRASASKVTKQLQISLRARRTSTTVTTATNTVLSARFILRNKQITT